MIKFTIYEKPMTVNRAWQGRRYKTREYRAYEELLLYRLRYMLPKKKPMKGKIVVRYRFYLRYAKTTDCDNLVKPLQDILQKVGCFEDDRQIYRATIEKIASKEDKIEVTIKKLR